jgi:hypothetical protein
MVHRVSLALTAILLSSAAAATAAELPTFEIIGFPLTQHQLAALNSGIVQERSPPPVSRLQACQHPRFRLAS